MVHTSFNPQHSVFIAENTDVPSPFLHLLHPCTVYPHRMLGCTVSRVWWMLGGCCFIRTQRIVHRGLIYLGEGIEADLRHILFSGDLGLQG